MPVPHRHLMTGNAADAEDLVQETFLRVAAGGTRFGQWINPAYARRILINLALHGARRPVAPEGRAETGGRRA